MKVWRVISLSIWTILLIGLLGVSMLYLVLSRTVLDESATLKALDSSHIYATLREDILVPRLTDQIAGHATRTNLITPEIVRESLSSSLSESDVKTLSRPIFDATYGWLDQKQPTISFSVPITSENDRFLANLEGKLREKIEALPTCVSYLDITNGQCLPRGTTSTQALSEIMASLRAQALPLGDTLTEGNLGLKMQQIRSAINVPEYIGYLWALNLITLPLAAIIALYLMAKRKSVGLILAGSVVTLYGMIALAGYLFAGTVRLPDDPLQHSLWQSGELLLRNALWPIALIGVGGGIVLIVLGAIWQHFRRPVADTTETTAEGEETPTEELLDDPVPVEEEKKVVGEKRPLRREKEEK